MKRNILAVISILLTAVLVLSSCSLVEKEEESTTAKAPESTTVLPSIDEDVSDSLKNFYRTSLPYMAFKSGVKNKDGAEISCQYSMLQKTAFVDFDSDSSKEIVLLYDISEEAGVANMDVAVYLDEKDGEAGIVYFNAGSYGVSDEEECFLLAYNSNNKVCLVRIVRYDSCEAVLVKEYGANGWTDTASAYHHIDDHDSVKLEENSFYVDHASGGLFNALTGKSVYSVEKFRNYRIPQEAFDGFINGFAAAAILP